MSFPNHPSRIEQVRYSWEKLKEDTGFGTADVQRCIATSAPITGPAMSLRNTGTVHDRTKRILFKRTSTITAQSLKRYPGCATRSPKRSDTHRQTARYIIDHDYFDDPAKYAITWRSYNKKYKGYFEPK